MAESAESIRPLLVFVARVGSVIGSVQGELDRLQESLDFLEEEHRVMSDTRGCREPHFFPFYHGANKPWRPDGRPMRFFAELVAEAQRLQTPVTLVVSGWLGLTTNSFVFDDLVGMFEKAGVDFKLRIYADEPRRFYDVNPQQARTALRGEYDRDVELEDSTWLFVEKFVAGNYVRCNLSQAALQVSVPHIKSKAYVKGSLQNVETENRQNTHPGMVRSFNKHQCEICDEGFWFSAFLELHMKRKHPRTESCAA